MNSKNVLTRERLQRLKAGKTLFELAAASGISMATLSMAERGFQRLTPEQERRRRDAIGRLASGSGEATLAGTA